MKKALLIFAIAGTLHAGAQNINPEFDHIRRDDCPPPPCCGGYAPSGWNIDLNGIGGALMQNLTTTDPASYYPNAVNTNISNLKYSAGTTYGFDIQAAYFFDEDQHFGAGTGFMYLSQKGNVTMDNFHVEYQSTDNFGSTFRQIITANGPVKENLVSTNINIPLLFKYKTEFSDYLGLSVDAGFTFNLVEKTAYSANASFDYEAIYKYAGVEGNIVPVYDNSPNPAAGDLVITRDRYLNTHTSGAVQEYFNTLAARGYNVGLGVRPNNNSGDVSYNSGSFGVLLRPALSIYLSDEVTLNVGAYYLYQNFTHAVPLTDRLTDKLGDYSSMLTNVSRAVNNSYGLSVGVRYSFPQQVEAVVPVFAAPEETNQGKVIEEDKDKDEDEAEMPTMPVPSPENNSTTEIVKEQKHINISTPILFDENKLEIQPKYYPVLEEAIKELNGHRKARLLINGYTDNTGKPAANKALSQKRANVVKNYLQKNGVSTKRLSAVGHGAASPAASNKTKEGRAKNRRVVMKLQAESKAHEAPAKKAAKKPVKHTVKHQARSKSNRDTQ
jgi:outer membrane protein OmpA-like peptidoglycan-associated protein